MWEPWVFDPAVSGSSLFSWCKVSLFMWKCFADTALFFLRNFICPLTTLWLSYVLILSRDGDQTWVLARDRRAFYHDQKIVSIDTYERFLFSWRMVLRGLPCELDIQDQQSQQRRFVLFFLYAEGRWGVPMHSIQLKTWLVINIYAKRLQKHKIARRDGVRPWSQHLGDWGKGISTFRPAWLRTICKEHKHEQQTKQTIIRSVVSSASMT